jgi:hypothetical protein
MPVAPHGRVGAFNRLMPDDRRGFLMMFPVVLELPPQASADDPDSPLWELADRIQDSINSLVSADREDLGCHQVLARDLQEPSSNAGRCARCGAWTTDWLRADRIEALRRGMLVEGELLCEDELSEQQTLKLYPPGS